MANRTLTGRTVLITGGASGIGAACARRLAADGARVLIADVDGGAAAKLAAELGQHAVRADVTRAGDIEAMLDAAWQRWGRLDVLFNNAGIIQGKPLLDVTPADWDRLMDVNLKAVFFVLQATARRMLQQDPIAGSELRGKMIHTASIAAYRGGLPLTAPYAASKAAVVSLARTAAQAFAPHRVTSNWCGANARGKGSMPNGRRSKAGRRAKPGSVGPLAFRSGGPSVLKTWRDSSPSSRPPTPIT